MQNEFSGKRIRQNATKIKQLKKRDKRLRKYGLSIVNFKFKLQAFYLELIGGSV